MFANLRVAVCSLLLLPLFLSGCHRAPRHLRVTFLDVGQGDCAVIETPSGEVVVIDGGGAPRTDERAGRDPGTRLLVPFLRSRGISTVDLLVATHPDDDHVQGLSAVVQRLNVRSALESGFPTVPNTPAARLQVALKTHNIPNYKARRGLQYDLGSGAKLEVIHPRQPFLTSEHSATNENAVALLLVYSDLRILFAADLGEAAERDLIASGQALNAQVLKVGHHGSRWSTSDAFLQAVKPQVAVISCGRDNNFGHPHKETMERLRGVNGMKVYRTDQQGAITLESDGKDLSVDTYLK